MSFITHGETSEQDISFIQTAHFGSNLLITLDYDISVAPERGETESLVLLVLLMLPSEESLTNVGSILFIRTNMGDRLLFWTLEDPFSSVGLWQQGMEYEYFSVDYNELSIIFIECPEIEHPTLKIFSFAKLLDIGTIDPDSVDFQSIVEVFRAEFEFSQQIETTDMTTSTTKAKGFPGFHIPLSIGLLIFVGFLRRNHKNKPENN